MKVYTCSPKRFLGNDGFFMRESGLFSTALESIGVESRAILLGPPREGDRESLIRASRVQLTDPEWWQSLKLDGLIFYSWASPQYNDIARSLASAGVPFLVNMDTCGMVSRLASPVDWPREAHLRFFAENPGVIGAGKAVVKWLVDGLTHRVAKRRIPHYDAATKIAAVTPLGALWIPGEARELGRPDLVEKFCYLPHPQSTVFKYNGIPKENLILSVGRWTKADWPQKNPKLLLRSLLLFLNARPDWQAMVVGSGAEILPDLLGIAELRGNPRVVFVDAIPPEELVGLYSRAKIGFWTSRWEGQQGTAAQMLCCGGSVVAPGSAHMSCFSHYVTRGSGRISTRKDAVSLATHLQLEAMAWDEGQREPQRISDSWTPEFHAPQVARRALEILGLNVPGNE